MTVARGKTALALAVALFALAASAQEAETDLPTETASPKGGSYFHDETPLTAVNSIYSDLFVHRWLDAPHDGFEPIAQAEQDRISDTFIAHWRKVAAETTDLKTMTKASEYVGRGLFYRHSWSEAEAAYSNLFHFVMRLPGDLRRNAERQQSLSVAYCGIAEAQLAEGRRDAALATIDAFFAANVRSGQGRGVKNCHRLASHARHWLAGVGLDGLKMPRFTDNRAFPEAQKATYSDKFVKCPAICLSLKGVADGDARVKLLRQKLASRGFAVGSGGYPLAVALDPKAKVEKREGYTLVATAKGCEIRARDLQGVLWGIVSFIQILDPARKAMRVCEIEDWPDCPRRGFYGRTWPDTCEFAVFNKMNYVTIKPYYLTNAVYDPFNVYCAASQAKEFRDLGLEFYATFSGMTMDCAWPLSWNVFRAMQTENAMRWAKLGVNIYYPYDDARYWESGAWTKEDQNSGLKPSDTDAKHVAAIYNAVKAKYPNFRMQFCPPFYWGPRKGHPYPDSRDKYLKSIAEHLPKEVDVIWTGERVGSHAKSRRDCLWYSNLIGRKPTLFQNKTGPHRYLSYVNDRTPWDKWFYPGFVTEDMAGIQKNSSTPEECPQITSLADYLWNVKAYDATRAIKRGLDNYAGKGVFETLEPAHAIACEYDRYHRYGTVEKGIRFKTLEEIERDYRTVMDATERVKPLMISTNQFERGMGAWRIVVTAMKNIRAWKLKNPDPRAKEAKYIANDVADAASQCGYDADAGDVLYDGYSFDDVASVYVPSKSKRDWHPVPESRVVANFKPGESGKVKLVLKGVPKKPVKAVLAAYGALANFKVEVNGSVGFEAKKAKPVKGFGDAPMRCEFELSAALFRKGENEILLTNTGRGEMNVVYLLIR